MSCQKNIRFCHRHGWKTSWRLVINIHLFRRSRSIIRPPSDTTESSYRSHLNVTWLMSYSCRYDAFETYKFNVSVDFRNVTLQWCRMLNVTRLCLCVVFAAGSRRVTHCKGMIHPEQHRRKYTVTPSLSLKVTSIVFELLFFFYPPSILSHLTMTCVPLLTPCTPFFFFCLFLFPSPPPPPHIHTSPSSPHFTTSLSDYADLSEPPHKKDWVFWGRQVGGGGAGQQRARGRASGEGEQQAAGEEDDPVLHLEPAEDNIQPERSAGSVQLQEPAQIPQPVLSDLLLRRATRGEDSG